MALFAAAPACAEELTLEQVLQKVVAHYPSLGIAAKQVEKARQDVVRVQSQLGWQLGLGIGYDRDVSFLNTPTDTATARGSLSRQLKSGATLGLEAQRLRQDADTQPIPTLPNPLTSTDVDLSLRQPLGKGWGNPTYREGVASAESGTQLAEADQRAVYDRLATQVIDLHLAARTTLERMRNTEASVARSKRLEQYIRKNEKLGVAEDKDLLQVTAQLNNQQAQLRALEMAWAQQRISLNRLMGRPVAAELEPVVSANAFEPDAPLDTLYIEASGYSAEATAAQARIQLADSAIRSRRDAHKDQLDLVVTLGSRARSGDTSLGSIDENESVGSVNLEYTRALNKSGLDAELYQARLDKSIALEEKQRVLDDLRYDLAALLAEMESGRAALDAYNKALASEQAKLKDAEKRYRQGRADTDQVIQFENQLSAAELALALQRVELQRRWYTLALLRGQLWKLATPPTLELPPLDTGTDTAQ